MKDLKVPLLTILFIFLSLFLYTKLFGPIPFSVQSVQTNKTNLFQVEGKGEVTGIPNTGVFLAGVTKTAPTVKNAQDQTNSAVNKILESLKNLGVEDKNIKTTNYSVYPNYDYTSGRQNITGYTVTQNLQIKITPIDKVNKAIDALTSQGTNMMGGISFDLDDKTQKDLEDKARQQAMQNAKEKAQSLANAAGIKLLRIVDVQEKTNGFQPIPFRTLELAQLTDKDQQTTVTPGQNTIISTVTLSYETY